MTTISTVHPAPVAAPRGAAWAASAMLALFGLLERLFTRRAAAPRTPAEEAEAVRDLARRLQASDPGMAADLFAAADRHACRA